MPIKSGLEAIIVLIYCPGGSGQYGEKVQSITRLLKLLYLVVEETSLGKFLKEALEFEAFDYGPYSNKIYDFIETLKDARILTVEQREYVDFREISDAEIMERELMMKDEQVSLSEKKPEIYGLSDAGMRAGKKLFEHLTPEEKEQLRDLKERFNPMSLGELIKYVYTKYPGSAIRSTIREEILGESRYGSRPTMKPFKRKSEDFRM